MRILHVKLSLNNVFVVSYLKVHMLKSNKKDVNISSIT